MEKKANGFMLLLHNCMELEDNTHAKLAEKARAEDEYDFLGVGAETLSMRHKLMLEDAKRAPPPKQISHK